MPPSSRLSLTAWSADTNPLAISWHDSTRIPLLNPSNVLDYFSNRSNPFYLKTCNNEVLRMQKGDMEQLR